jgi:hypothetical protein
MTVKEVIGSTYSDYLALNRETIEIIDYMATATKKEVGHDSMIATIQMLTHLFTRLDKLETKLEWLSNKILSLDDVKGTKQSNHH